MFFLSSSPSPAVARRRAFSVVLAIELWERFGYYGMQAVLTLFMVEHLHLRDQDANLMQGAFALLAYSLPVLGGVLGDYLLGARLTLLMGAVGLTLGYGVLALSLTHPLLFLPALALVALSNGLFKPNAGALVRHIYEGDDTALDAAFTLYYMSINVGSTVSMLLMPWLEVRFGPAIAFGGCALGLVVGISCYFWRLEWLRRFLPASSRGMNQPRLSVWMGVGLGTTLCGLWIFAVLMLAKPALAQACVVLASTGLFLLWGWLYHCAAPCERPGLALTYLLCLQTVAYQIFYQQMQTSLTLFALRSVSGDYKFGSVTIFHMSAGQFQALNPIWIMFFSPVLAWFYQRWATAGRDASLPLKILCGYICVGAAFLLWWLSSKWANGLVSPWVMVFGYGIISLGELLTIGLGLAIIARYAPARISALMMGSLFLLWGVGMYAGSLVANMAALSVGTNLAVDPGFYAPLFRGLFLGAALLCVLLVGFLPVVSCLGRKHANVMHKEREIPLDRILSEN